MYIFQRKRANLYGQRKLRNFLNYQRKFYFLRLFILVHLNYSRQFEVYCDASSFRVGAMLAQVDRAITYVSRILNSVEWYYSITQRKCLTVICALNKFSCNFNGLPVNTITNYLALTKLTNGKSFSVRITCWSLKLAGYTSDVEHRDGKKMSLLILYLITHSNAWRLCKSLCFGRRWSGDQGTFDSKAKGISWI